MIEALICLQYALINQMLLNVRYWAFKKYLVDFFQSDHQIYPFKYLKRAKKQKIVFFYLLLIFWLGSITNNEI